jgi:hypothetical protein
MVWTGRTRQLGEGRFAGQADSVSLESVNCPTCKVCMLFLRGRDPLFDECGFESYRLNCDGCGARFCVTVDPSDQALLLSQIAD